MAGARNITMRVTGKVVGYAYTQNYQSDADQNLYLVPTYQMDLEWTGEDGKRNVCTFEVIRFGPAYNRDENTGRWRLSNSGLKDAQKCKIDLWMPDYETTIGKYGAWHVYYEPKPPGRYLVHAGPDDAQVRPAQFVHAQGAAGCIEVCGEGQWAVLNQKILEATGLGSFQAVAQSKPPILRIMYEPVAKYPDIFKNWISAPELSWAVTFTEFRDAELRGRTPAEFKPQCSLPEPTPDFIPLTAASLILRSITKAIKADPLILDLNHDGITTTTLSNEGPWFDHDGNGFAEASAWVDPDDGLLVMDRNGNGIIDDGRELFGNGTILSSGKKASNGFEALTAFDSNGDGKIDAADPVFSQLRVWKDEDSDEYSLSEELWTLDELGITSINLSSTMTQITDEHGNVQNRSGSFQWADGRTGQIGEYTLQRDTMYTIPNESLVVPADTEDLPDLKGYGNVYDLHQAMVRDTTGQLVSLVSQFVAATEVSQRNSLVDRILFQWTGSQNVEPTSRGTFIDARKLSVLESFFGQAFVGAAGPNLTEAGAALINQSYYRLFELTYSELMQQTHLKDLFDMVWCGHCEETNSLGADMSVVIYELNNRLAADPEQGRLVLSEFARSVRGLELLDTAEYLSFRETFIQQDPNLGWVIDTGGLPVYDQLGQGDGWYYPHMFGTWGSDAVKGSATVGDGWINGLDGDDVIYGTDRNETLINGTGDALLYGGGGNDIIWAGPGADILDGGTGNDVLYGESGNDTYIFRIGSGNDTIIDPDPTPGNIDTIWLGSNLTPQDISLKRVANNLVLKIIDTTDTLTVKDFFYTETSRNRVEQIQFMDGTVWTESDMIRIAYSPSEGNDFIFGGSGDDNLSGLGGNDWIYGQGGEDTVHGDSESDRLYGGSGNDTVDAGTGNDYVYGEGDNDTLLGGDGADWIIGGPGDDLIDGGPGNDVDAR